MSEEFLDILDQYGNKTGQTKARTAVHRDGDWHRAVNIFIINDKNEVLLQRRSANKDSYPNMWDVSCGGHLSAGDTPLEGAVRELKEELGIDVESDELELILEDQSSARPAPDFINNSFNNVYILHTILPISELVLQESEVADVKYVTLEKLKNMVQSKDPTLVEHRAFYERLFEILE